MAFDEFEEVYVAHGPIELDAVVGVLEAAGLSPRVRDMRVTPYPVTVGPLGERRVLVRKDQAGTAREALRRAARDGILPTSPEPSDGSP
ncbi:MAG: hypothetical protein Kow0092_14120 [Deferrisomatales bacterium]